MLSSAKLYREKQKPVKGILAQAELLQCAHGELECAGAGADVVRMVTVIPPL